MDKAVKEKLLAAAAALILTTAMTLLSNFNTKTKVEQASKTTVEVIEAQNVFRDKEREGISLRLNTHIRHDNERDKEIARQQAKDEEQDRRLDRQEARKRS